MTYNNKKIAEDRVAKPVSKMPKPAVADTASRTPDNSPADSMQRVTTNPSNLSHADFFELQRTLGNRAVGTMLERSEPQHFVIQPKLTVNAAGDKYEQEADRIAGQVSTMATAKKESENEKGMTISGMQGDGNLDSEVNANVENQLRLSRGNGQPLSSELKDKFETTFGLNFSDVRVHADAQADRLNKNLRARAFTTGTDIFFRHGEFEPRSQKGQALIAHELTHVVQQSGGSGEKSAQPSQLDKMNNPDKSGINKINRMNPIQNKIQKWGEMSTLRKYGWKYSGGNIATTDCGGLWHATVFRVDKSGKSDNNGLFFDGFHLTMEFGTRENKINPHVFFSSNGEYVETTTVQHPQTKNYIKEVGAVQWKFDLSKAEEIAQEVKKNLGPELKVEEMEKIETERDEELTRKKEEQELIDIESAKKEKERIATEAAAIDEETNIKALLTDVNFNYGPYPGQFINYVKDQVNNDIKDSTLKKIAVWYLGGRNNRWLIKEKPKAAYKDWGKTPIEVKWTPYQNCEQTIWREKNPDNGFLSEYRELRFNGYASYKLHPLAFKPPKS